MQHVTDLFSCSFLKAIFFLILNIFFKTYNITLDPDLDLKWAKNSGSGSNFIVFGSTTLLQWSEFFLFHYDVTYNSKRTP